MNFMMTFRGVATAKRVPGRDGKAAGAANGDNDIVARKEKAPQVLRGLHAAKAVIRLPERR
ncbi:hypothetical protein [Cupriavidus basilensis]|nr:hypothetical protein [Cupriavidus basilensis]